MKNIDFSKYYDDAKFYGIAAGIILLLYFAYRILNRATKSKEEMRVVEVDESNLTLTPTDAQLIAENLLSAMNRFGTDNAMLYEEFSKIKTKEDAILVSEKFGLKKYDGYGHSMFLGQPKNLKGWVNAELDKSWTNFELTESEIQEILTKLNWI